MSTKYLLTRSYKVHAAQQLIESFTESGKNYYYSFIGKHTQFPGSDSQVTQPTDSVRDTCSSIYQDMIAGKLLDSNDVSLVIPRYDWLSGTVYTQYDDVNEDLYATNFIVTIAATDTTLDVYKCLFNNYGAKSTSAPSRLGTGADGYIWKYLYTINANKNKTFATKDHIPVTPNTSVSNAAVSGAIDVVLVTSNGTNYDSSYSGTFESNTDIIVNSNNLIYSLSGNASSNNDFYNNSAIYIETGPARGQLRKIIDYTVEDSVKNIIIESAFDPAPAVGSNFKITPFVKVVGDGTGFEAIATVDSDQQNSIVGIEVTKPGTDYTHATVTLEGNTGGTSNSAVLRAILPPKGGHGANIEEETGASSICFTLKFEGSEDGSIPLQNSIRTVGILKDPTWSNVVFNTANVDGTFLDGDSVINFEPEHFYGEVTFAQGSNTVTGIDTNFGVGIGANDYIFISNGTASSIRQIVSVSNSSSIEVDRVFTYSMTSGADYYKAYVVSQGIVANSTTNTLTLNQVTGMPNTDFQVCGIQSDATADISSIEINGRTTPASGVFNSFDQRWRYTVSTASGTFDENEKIYTSNTASENAIIHSVNSSLIAATNKYGDIEDNIFGANSGAQANIISYVPPDLESMSGQVLYIENTEAFERASNRSETFKVVVEF